MTVIINGTTGISGVDGSAAAPAATGADTDSGIVYGTNTVSLATNGTTALTVNSSQNVGIGTASPSYKLDILTGGGGVYAAQFGNGTAAQGMRIVTGMDSTSSGITTAGGTRLIQFDGTNNITQFYTNTSERMRIDSSGNVGIGTSSPATKLHVNGLMGNQVNTQTVPTPDNGANPIQLLSNNFSGGSGETNFWNTASSLTGGIRLMQVTGSGTYNDMAWFQKNAAIFYTGNTEVGRFDSAGLFKFNSGYGSAATAYGCRAWANFTGVGSVSIRGSGNVSSIAYTAAGKYTVNLSSALTDANYALALGICGLGNSGGGKLLVEDSSGTGGTIGRTSSAFVLISSYSFTNPGGATTDNAYSNSVAVFR